MKGPALEHGQVVVHRTAAAGRLFDDDAAGRAQRGDLLQQVAIAQVIGRQARRPGRNARLRARGSRPRLEQRGNTQLQMSDDGGADGTPCRRARVIGQLHQRGVLRDVRPVAFDMIGEHRRTQRQNEIRALQTRDDAAPIRRQKAGEQRVIFRKAVARRHGTDPDRGPMLFGESDGFIPGVIARHRCADDDHRPPGIAQRLRGALQQQ